jgi:hypothetical protein
MDRIKRVRSINPEIDDVDFLFIGFIFLYGPIIGFILSMVGIIFKMIFGKEEDKETLKQLLKK